MLDRMNQWLIESMPTSGGHWWNVVGWCTEWCAVLGAVDKEGWGDWGRLVPPGTLCHLSWWLILLGCNGIVRF